MVSTSSYISRFNFVALEISCWITHASLNGCEACIIRPYLMFLLTLTLNMGVWFEITFMFWHRCDPVSLMHLRGCICNLV